MTWEDVLPLAAGPAGQGAVWEALIPSMGYMALLRNLRNFDEAGVSDEVAARSRRGSPTRRRSPRSRQLPMRFLSAYRAAPSLRWAYALEQALGRRWRNMPRSPAGR